MHLIKRREAPTFTLDGTTATGYAAPSRGASETCLWRVRLAAGAASPLHRLDREEVLLGLGGRASVAFGGEERTLEPGDCLVVPAGLAFTLATVGDEPFDAVACLPVGGRGTILPDGPTFVPPWAE